MPRFVTFAVAWAVAAAVALGVAWQGVGVVGDNVTERRPAPLTAREVRDRATAADEGASTEPGRHAGGTSTTVPTPSTSPSPPAAPATTVTTAAAPAEPVASTTTTSSPPKAAETRTYNLVGGSAALRFTPSGVSVLWANPSPGFSVEIEPEQPDGVEVELESESHRSRVAGWWDGGPRDVVREEPDASGEGDGSGSRSGGGASGS